MTRIGLERTLSFCLTLWFVFGSHLVFGQLQRLDSPEAFSESSVLFDLSLYRFAEDATFALADWGIELKGTSGAKAVILPEPIVNFSTIPVIELAPRDESAGQALVLNFSRAVKRVGFNLGNGRFPQSMTEVSSSISAFSLQGESLGGFRVEDIQGKFGSFVGMESSFPEGIAKVVVDYEDSANSERLSELRVDFLRPHEYRSYLPQIVDADLPNGGRLQSVLLLINNSGQKNEVVLEFFDPAGKPQSRLVNGESIDHLELSLSHSQSLRLATEMEDGLRLGYGRLRSSQPLQAVTLYRVSEAGSLLREVGAPSETAASYVTGYAEWNTDLGLGTAVALVFLGDQPRVTNQIIITLVGESDGVPVTIPDRLALGEMEFGEHRAFFLSDLVSSVGQFSGTVMLQGTSRFVASILRTQHGLPVSGLPSGSTSRTPESP